VCVCVCVCVCVQSGEKGRGKRGGARSHGRRSGKTAGQAIRNAPSTLCRSSGPPHPASTRNPGRRGNGSCCEGDIELGCVVVGKWTMQSACKLTRGCVRPLSLSDCLPVSSAREMHVRTTAALQRLTQRDPRRPSLPRSPPQWIAARLVASLARQC
jgi:hypothetical protein